ERAMGLCIDGLVVPAYVHPSTAAGTPDQIFWGRLAVASKALGQRLIVIINPDSGPGNAFDQSYKDEIDALHLNDSKVLGYVATNYAQPLPAQVNPRTPGTISIPAQTQIQGDITAWYDFYKDID